MCKTHAKAFRWHNNKHYSAVRKARSFEGTLPRCVYLRSGRCGPLSRVSREAAKPSRTFPIFPCRPSLPFADNSRSAILRRRCAVTRSGCGLLLSESEMSHETSLHTSRTVLLASITICSCLAIVSVFRLCLDSLNSTESAHSSSPIDEASHDRSRTDGEFHPRSETRFPSTTSQVSRSFPPGRPVRSTTNAQRSIQALSQLQSVSVSRPESQRSSRLPHGTETVSAEESSQLQVPESDSIVVLSPAANIVGTEESIANVDDELVSMTPISAPPIEMTELTAVSALDAVVLEVVPLPEPSGFSMELIARPESISDEPSHFESRIDAPILEEAEIVLFPESIEQPNAIANSLPSVIEPEPSLRGLAFAEPTLPAPLPLEPVPATILTGPTSAILASMDPDDSASAAANDVMMDDNFTFPATSGGAENEHGANPVSPTLTQEMSAGHASSGTADNSQRTVSPLTRMRERMAGFRNAPSRPGFDRPDWMDDLEDWRERQTDAISAAAGSLTIPSQARPRNPGAHQERQTAQHALGKQGRTDSRPLQRKTQPEHARRPFAGSVRNADPPEWIGSVRNAAAEQSVRSSQMLHRATSAVRFAARPKTVD